MRQDEMHKKLRVLSGTLRWPLLMFLSNGEKTVTQASIKFGLTLSRISHQVLILKKEGFLSRRKKGRNSWYETKMEEVRKWVII